MKIRKLVYAKIGPMIALSAGMKTVIILSKCLRVTKINAFESCYEFHFRGVCAGETLRKVLLRGREDFEIRPGAEYLLYVQLVSIEGGTLRGTILKLRPLADYWDRR
jgi:hypothetical protein